VGGTLVAVGCWGTGTAAMERALLVAVGVALAGRLVGVGRDDEEVAGDSVATDSTSHPARTIARHNKRTVIRRTRCPLSIHCSCCQESSASTSRASRDKRLSSRSTDCSPCRRLVTSWTRGNLMDERNPSI